MVSVTWFIPEYKFAGTGVSLRVTIAVGEFDAAMASMEATGALIEIRFPATVSETGPNVLGAVDGGRFMMVNFAGARTFESDEEKTVLLSKT